MDFKIVILKVKSHCMLIPRTFKNRIPMQTSESQEQENKAFHVCSKNIRNNVNFQQSLSFS